MEAKKLEATMTFKKTAFADQGPPTPVAEAFRRQLAKAKMTLLKGDKFLLSFPFSVAKY